MSDLQCINLIDLSLEEDLLIQDLKDEPIIKTETLSPILPPLNLQPLNPSCGVVAPSANFISPSCKKRDSLDNNPFDCVQKLANSRQDDPFDIIEREACLKAQTAAIPPVEVKLGNLLSLSNENLLEEEAEVEKECVKEKHPFDLESESPPVAMMERHLIPPTESGTDSDSNPNSSAESGNSCKMKKALEYRRRLLKLSVTNSAFQSPASRRSSLEQSDTPGTPVSSLLSKDSQYEENLLAAESPLKFVDDDIMAEEEPPSMLMDSEKNFEADLEMLNIPMLNEINNPSHEESLMEMESKLLESLNAINTPSTAYADLEAIKAKLKAKRIESNNNHHHDINALISDLKSLINSGESVDTKTKVQASTILETLSSALSTSHHSNDISIDTLNVPPQPIKRQGTFDIELKEDEEKEASNKDEDKEKQTPVNELPACMISSTATYDGETVEERLDDLQLPEIDPLSPQEQDQKVDHQTEVEEYPPKTEITLQSDMNDIMEQISKLLISNNNSGDPTQTGQQQPTVIVLMNTSAMPQNTSKDKSSSGTVMASSFMEMQDGSPDLNNSAMPRRRSQSLSIHDKVKIVQLPLKPPTPKRLQKQPSIDLDVTPSLSTTPPPNNLETPEFKTPARMVRRNSYSSGTPYTATFGGKKTGFSSDGKSTTHVRRTPTLGTHHEGQQQQQQKAIVRPMSMPPSTNMATFKPDLKKKNKTNTESIMKSTGPLKATIPVKKVAPMIKTSPAPETRDKSPIQNSIKKQQQQNNKVPTTPITSLRVANGFPNACSTPSNVTTPLKRTSLSGGVTKPKYSYLSATPNAKANTSTTGGGGGGGSSSTGLKRRTITDFKSRSPLKPRMSVSSAASTSRASTTTTSARLSLSVGAKLPTKVAPTSKVAPPKVNSHTATVKPTGRLTSSSRLSTPGSTISARNKENKQP